MASKLQTKPIAHDLLLQDEGGAAKLSNQHGYQTDFYRQLAGESLATAEILYHMPDYPKILQCFVWQTLDVAPDFPRLLRFLTYWQDHIEADLHHVTIAHRALVAPTQMKIVDGEFLLH